MDDPARNGAMRFFAELPDPRAANVRHRLPDILLIALCAVICGAEGWEDFKDFARAKAKWFATFMDLQHGVPSADTFRRVFSRLDPDAFESCFTEWMQSAVALSGGKLVAIDGKSIRRSFDHAWDKSGMTHMVSAFVAENAQVFSQIKTDSKNELKAITQLLGLIDLRDAIVSIDAAGCQTSIAKQITEVGGDYVLCVKDNQRSLHRAIRTELDDMVRDDFADVAHDRHESTEAGHGRIETRKVYVTDQLDWLKQARDWPGLRSIAMVEAHREVPAHGSSVQRRYYISSLPPDAAAIGHAIRNHWSIENSLHHVLDVSFREDESRIRRDHGPENVSRLRRIGLNLLKTHGSRHTTRKSIKGRRKIAGWDHDFLLKLITG